MRGLLILLTLGVLGLQPGTASAFDLEESLRQQHVQFQASDSMTTAQDGGMSLSQAISSVRNRTGGKIVDAQTRVQGGREVHHIKVLLKDGRVKTFKVNGRRR